MSPSACSLHLQRHNRGAALVDGLGVLREVTLLDAFARERRDIGVEEGRTPPLAVARLEGRAVAEETSGELPRAVRAGDFVRGAVIQIVAALAALVGGPRGAEVNVLAAHLDHGGAFVADHRFGLALRVRPAAGRINAHLGRRRTR